MTEPGPKPDPAATPSPADDGIEELLVEALDRLERDGAAAVERLLAEHPAAAPRLRAHLERLHRIGLASGGGPAAHPERLGEFRITGVLGQGGMGVVYRAVQESLGREVALKVVRPEQLFFPGARERFRREVELVARMQHPGIVPIHAVGSDAGVPYFAMELVRGVSLAAVVEQLAGRSPAALTGRDLDAVLAAATGDAARAGEVALFAGSWTQIVLRIGRELADALEHAHRRGVLHRDVKPSNAMLTRGGRVLLLDFGLAGAEGQERMTRTGSALGSLAYLPPEVLGGAPARDVRGDVYALGVTLWELLALQLPYQSSDPLVLRELAGAAKRPRLATRVPGVPWDVETVLATAMDPDPARRYASAALFSQDLDNLLQHRPIAARQAGPWLRLRRWSQRHPARATAAAAAIVLLVGGPSLWALQEGRARERIEAQRDELRRANQELERARGRAVAESARARGNFQQLQKAVDTMLTRVGDQSLRDVPRMEVVRRELLGEALRFYEGFLAEQPDDPTLRTETAQVRVRMAEAQALLGDYGAARREVERALAGLDGVDDPDLLLVAARARNRHAASLRLTGELPAAAEAAAAAVAAWERLVGVGDTVEVARGRGEARLESGLIAVDRGRLDEAIAAAETSLREVAAVPAPSQGQLVHLGARTKDRLGVWLFQRAMQLRDKAMLERAVALHDEAATAWTTVLADRADTQIRADAAQNRISSAMPLRLLGRHDEALAAVAAGVEAAAALVADYPASQRRRAELANARGNYAALLGIADRTDDSRRQSELALALWEGLAREAPGNDEYTIGLAHVRQGLAVATWYGGDPAAAAPLLQAAGEAADRALAVRPDNPTYRRVRRKIGETLATLCLDRRDAAGAAAAARVLLEARLRPTEPVLAAALLARAGVVAGPGALAVGLRAEAEALLQSARADGGDPVQWRQDPTLADQWGHPAFVELVDGSGSGR